MSAIANPPFSAQPYTRTAHYFAPYPTPSTPIPTMTTTNYPAHVLRPVDGCKPIPIPPAPAMSCWDRQTYRTGDGETLGAVRPGSQDHAAVPSLAGNVRSYRDGRREVAA